MFTDRLSKKQLAPVRKLPMTLLTYAVLLFLSFLFLFPFYIILRNALGTRQDITSYEWVWIPRPLQFHNFQDVLDDPIANVSSGLKNSAIIAVIQTAGQLFLASLAGYGLARIPFRWHNLVFYFILATLMIPAAVTFIPTFLVIDALGWVSTYQGIIAPGLFSAFATVLFRQSFLDFPRELEDAGRVDGLGYWGIFRYIVVPNSRNIFCSLGIISFINSWNSFLWPLVVGQDQSMWTIQVTMSTFITAQTINLPGLFMTATIAIFPIVALFFLLQRYLVKGITFTGIKG